MKNAAREIDNERRLIEARGIRATRKLTYQIRSAVLRAYKMGGNPADAVHQYSPALVKLLTDAAVLSHVTGALRSGRHLAAAQSRRGSALDVGDAYQSALRAFQKRNSLDQSIIPNLQRLYKPEVINKVRLAQKSVSDAVGAAVQQTIKQGMHVNAGIAHLRKAFDGMGLALDKPYLYETLFRSESAIAYTAGRLKANNDPAIQEILWGYEYQAIDDGRARSNHLALDGVRKPKDDPFWATNMPPNGYNCRCTISEIFNFENEAVDTGALPNVVTVDGNTIPVVPAPDKGWSFNPVVLGS